MPENQALSYAQELINKDLLTKNKAVRFKFTCDKHLQAYVKSIDSDQWNLLNEIDYQYDSIQKVYTIELTQEIQDKIFDIFIRQKGEESIPSSNYMLVTENLPLTIEPDEDNENNVFLSAALGPHRDMFRTYCQYKGIPRGVFGTGVLDKTDIWPEEDLEYLGVLMKNVTSLFNITFYENIMYYNTLWGFKGHIIEDN